LLVPLVLIQNDSNASASDTGQSDHHSASSVSHGAVPPWRLTAATKSTDRSATATTTTTTASPSTTAATAPVAAHMVANAVPSTTTTTPTTIAPTTTTAPLAVTSTGGSTHYGQVTYYEHPAGTCASPFLPFGTVVQVTNPANGATATCLVNDREADTARSIDLATDTFAELAPLSQGVIDAQLTW
jgi:rare lipoprotein A